MWTKLTMVLDMNTNILFIWLVFERILHYFVIVLRFKLYVRNTDCNNRNYHWAVLYTRYRKSLRVCPPRSETLVYTLVLLVSLTYYYFFSCSMIQISHMWDVALTHTVWDTVERCTYIISWDIHVNNSWNFNYWKQVPQHLITKMILWSQIWTTDYQKDLEDVKESWSWLYKLLVQRTIVSVYLISYLHRLNIGTTIYVYKYLHVY